MSFKEIPIIDLAKLKNPSGKEEVLGQIRHALIEVGFLILQNFHEEGPSVEDFDEITNTAKKFFALPAKEKKKCGMINSRHFLGYTELANEITSNHTDWREQIDLATELPPPGSDEPIYRNVEGPNLWPEESVAPDFKPVVLGYIEKMTRLSRFFRKLACEALDLPQDAFEKYMKPNQQCKMKLIAYPDASDLVDKSSKVLQDSPSTSQGVGPHRDSDLITFIYQATPHTDSLQAQNFQGEWITLPYVEDSLVVNAGQTLEAVTDGVCKATIHRVLTPIPGSGTRISIPFFQTINLDSYKAKLEDIPPHILQLKRARDQKIENWGADTSFQFTPKIAEEPVGVAVFKNRIKSHQDVAAKWYPDILKSVLAEYQ